MEIVKFHSVVADIPSIISYSGYYRTNVSLLSKIFREKEKLSDTMIEIAKARNKYDFGS